MLLTILQIAQGLSAVVLIGLILIHSPKSDGLGGMGGATQLFSSHREAEAGLNKLTYWVAGFFFLLSLILGLYGGYFAQ